MARIADIDLSNPDTLLAGVPHEYFTRLRNEQPVYWHESDFYPPGFWVCTKYQDVIGIERDAKTYSSARGGALLDDQGEGTELMMLNQDPPQHTRLRNLVARGFTPKVIKGMEPHIREAARLIVSTCRPRNSTTHQAKIRSVIWTSSPARLLIVCASSRGIFSVQINSEPSTGLTPSCDQPPAHST